MITLDDVQHEWTIDSKIDPELLDEESIKIPQLHSCLLYTSPSPRDRQKSRMPSSA